MNYKKGFTLVEMIVVVAIIALLTAITVPNVAGYMVSSEMMKVNQTAKTLFLAAQDYLTEATISGTIDEINIDAKKVSDSILATQMAARDGSKDSSEEIAYLSLNKDQEGGVGAQWLRQILKRYVGDKPMLLQSILIEYNKKSGVVRSVLYSERADYLNYDGDVGLNTNVVVRTEKALREKRQGYYGVSYTGSVQEGVTVKPKGITLVNSDRLYVEWDDVAPASDRNLTYTLVVTSTDSGHATEYLRIEGIPSASTLGERSFAEAVAAPLKGLATAWNGEWRTGENETSHRIAVYAPEKNKPTKMALILDDLHASIFENYPTIPVGNITVSITPVLDWIEGSTVFAKNPAHAYFGDTPSNLTSFFSSFFTKSDTAFPLFNARHLNNIRYASPENGYTLQNGIDWTKPETEPCGPDKQFETVVFRQHQYENEKLVLKDGKPDDTLIDSGYKGVFNGSNHSLMNLTLGLVNGDTASEFRYTMTQNIGFFARLSGAEIKDLTLSGIQTSLKTPTDSSLNYENVGALAGFAENATLTNCSVKAYEENNIIIQQSLVTVPQSPAESGGSTGNVGGLIGYVKNSTLTDCFVALEVINGRVLSAGNGRNKVESGGDNTGGLIGYAEETTITRENSDPYTVSVYGGNNTGGLVGHMVGGSINYHKVTMSDRNAYTIAGENAVGGIVGLNEGGTLSNIQLWDQNLAAPALCNSRFSAILKELSSNPAQFEVNALSFAVGYCGIVGQEMVGGAVGYNLNGKLNNVTSAAEVRGVQTVGGLIGKGEGAGSALTFGASASASGGIAVCAGDYAGGIYGVNESAAIKGLNSKTFVLAAQYAGGIVGANGERGTEQDDRLLIENCESFGVAFAYKQYGGGIAGCNMGKITDCKTSNNASVFNLTLGTYIGGITGYNGEGATIDNCAAQSLVLGNQYVGGITGQNDGYVKKCEVKSTVRGTDFVGGIVGHNNGNGQIIACSTKGGTVTATGDFVGGLIGLNTTGNFESQAATTYGSLINLASVTGRRCVGGIIGGNITQSGKLAMQATNGSTSTKPSILGEAYVGGIIGYNCASQDPSYIPDPYQLETVDESGTTDGITSIVSSNNYGKIGGIRFVGGIIGLNSDKTRLQIKTCYNNGSIEYNTTKCSLTGTDKTQALSLLEADGNYYIAGITGRNTITGYIESSINNGGVSNISAYTGGLVEVNEGIIYKCENSGTVLSSRTGVSAVGGIAGLNRYAGKPSSAGEIVTETALILECAMRGVSAEVKGVSFAGGITGENQATLENCGLQSGKVTAVGNGAGGITGYNTGDGLIKSCETAGGTVSGKYVVGGLVGYHDAATGLGDVYPLTNNAKVFGQDYVGGIVGYTTQNTLSNCINGANGLVIGRGNASNGKFTISSYPNSPQLTLTGATGGIIGAVRGGQTVSNCTNLGNVIGYAYTGGIAGLVQASGTVKNSVNQGRAAASTTTLSAASVFSDAAPNGDNAGGITGRNNGLVEGCSAKDDTTADSIFNVTGQYNIGGLVGVNNGTLKNGTIQSKNYCVTGLGNTGGLVGKWLGGTVEAEAKLVQVTVRGASARRTIAAIDFITAEANAKDSTKWEALKLPAIGGIFGVNLTNLPINGYTFEGTVSYEDPSVRSGAANNTRMYAGGIVGYNPADRTVSGCTIASGSAILGKTYDALISKPSGNAQESSLSLLLTVGAGGIAGFNNGVIDSCSLADSGVTVQGSFSVGGLIGSNYFDGALIGTVSNGKNGTNKIESVNAVKGDTPASLGGYIGTNYGENALVRTAQTALSNSAAVSGTRMVGGIVGTSAGNIAFCNNGAAGKVTATGDRVGGVAGAQAFLQESIYTNQNPKPASLKVSDCKNEGTVTLDATSDLACGGIVGVTIANGSNRISIENCTNQATVTGSQRTGGILGDMRGGPSVTNCTNEGTVTSVQSQIGGIIGYSNGGYVFKCTNNGNVFPPSINDMNAGGIAGYVDGASTFDTCVNAATAQVGKEELSGSVLGGILGKGFLYTKDAEQGVKVITCVNKQELDLKNMTSVGGIVGSSVGVQVTGCNNTGTIYGGAYIGGIIGSMSKVQNNLPNLNWITNCINSGEIYGNRIGGIVGSALNAESAYRIANCENTAKITVNRYAGIVGSLGGSGGILGYDRSSLQFGEIGACINRGEIVAGADENYNGVGGIAGDVNVAIVIDSCKNYGKVWNGGSGKMQRVGGIAGYITNVNSIVKYSYNYGTVLCENGSDGISGVNIGGIVGHNLGVVRSCQNLKDQNGTIEGRENVGGIVGNNEGKYAFVYSGALETDLSKVDLVTKNDMEVKANYTKAGGIVGMNSGGAVVGTLNAGTVITADIGGGLIGFATSSGDVVGTLANSFNLGDVEGRGSLGGIIGFRKDQYDSVNSHNVKNSFFYDKTQSTLARLAEVKLLAIGNEPEIGEGEAGYEAYQALKENDTPNVAPLNKFILNNKICEAYGVTPPSDWSDLTKVMDVVLQLLKLQGYQLDQPLNVHTVSTKAYEYTTSWSMVQGLVSGYEVYLRPTGLDKYDSSKDIKLGQRKADTEGGRLETQLSFDVKSIYDANKAAFQDLGINSFEEMIGKQFDIVVVTLGLNDGQPSGAQNSKKGLSEHDRKILPVLPTPGDQKTIQIEVGENKVYTFTLPGELYDGIVDPALYPNATDPLYQNPYVDGLQEFYVYDALTDTRISANALTFRDIFQFVIDHNALGDDKRVDYTLNIQARSNNSTDGYAHSLYAEISYHVQTRLPSPQNLKAAFVDIQNGKFRYDLSWNTVEHATGYSITVAYTDADGNEQTQTETVGTSSKPSYRWTTDGKNLRPGEETKVKFTVQAMGEENTKPEEDVLYLTSYLSTPCEFNLPMKLKAPIVTVNRVIDPTDEGADTRYTVVWEDADKDQAAKFTVTAQKRKLGDPAAVWEPFTLEIVGNTAELKFDSDSDFGYEYRFTAVTLGNNKTTITSDEGAAQLTLYERLPRPQKLESPVLQADKESAMLTWSGKSSAYDVYPSEALKFTLILEAAGQNMVSIPIEGQDLQSLLDGTYLLERKTHGLAAGINYTISLRGSRVEGSYSRSPISTGVGFRFPDQLPLMEGLKAILTPASADPVEMDQYEKTSRVKLTWTLYAPETLAKVRSTGSYQAAVTVDGVDVTDQFETLLTAMSNTNQNSQEVSFKVPLEYAGKVLSIRIKAAGGDQALDAEWCEAVELRLPKAQLTAPEITNLGAQVTKENEKWVIKFTMKDDGNALAGLLSNKVKAENIRGGSFHFTVEYEWVETGTENPADAQKGSGSITLDYPPKPVPAPADPSVSGTSESSVSASPYEQQENLIPFGELIAASPDGTPTFQEIRIPEEEMENILNQIRVKIKEEVEKDQTGTGDPKKTILMENINIDKMKITKATLQLFAKEDSGYTDSPEAPEESAPSSQPGESSIAP